MKFDKNGLRNREEDTYSFTKVGYNDIQVLYPDGTKKTLKYDVSTLHVKSDKNKGYFNGVGVIFWDDKTMWKKRREG